MLWKYDRSALLENIMRFEILLNPRIPLLHHQSPHCGETGCNWDRTVFKSAANWKNTVPPGVVIQRYHNRGDGPAAGAEATFAEAPKSVMFFHEIFSE
jgi:hypothetical protein